MLDPLTVRRALASGDITTLTRVPGVGKKSAERMILELRERIGPISPAEPASSPTEDPGGPTGASWQDQVAQGLVGLGWSGRDAGTAIAAVAESLPADEPVPAMPVLLRQAIRQLGRAQ